MRLSSWTSPRRDDKEQVSVLVVVRTYFDLKYFNNKTEKKNLELSAH
jgi:hypothetical protein